MYPRLVTRREPLAPRHLPLTGLPPLPLVAPLEGLTAAADAGDVPQTDTISKALQGAWYVLRWPWSWLYSKD